MSAESARADAPNFQTIIRNCFDNPDAIEDLRVQMAPYLEAVLARWSGNWDVNTESISRTFAYLKDYFRRETWKPGVPYQSFCVALVLASLSEITGPAPPAFLEKFLAILWLLPLSDLEKRSLIFLEVWSLDGSCISSLLDQCFGLRPRVIELFTHILVGTWHTSANPLCLQKLDKAVEIRSRPASNNR